MKTFPSLLLLLAAATAAASCDRSGNTDRPAAAGTECTIATAWGKWVYFSLTKGDTVGTAAATAANDTLWKARTDWDMAFLIHNVRTNSGTSGVGQGGACDTGTADFDAVTGAPASGYTVDAFADNIMYNMPPRPGTGIGTVSLNPALAAWTVMHEADMSFEVSPRIFAVRTATGRHAKVCLKSMVTDPGNPSRGRLITLEWGLLD